MLQNAVFKDGELIGGYARIKSVEVNEKFSVAEVMASKKNMDGEYEMDYYSKFVNLIGRAHELAKKMTFPANIQITSLGSSNVYKKNGELVFRNSSPLVIMDFVASSKNNDNSVDSGNSKPAQKANRKEPDFVSVESAINGADELPFE